MSGFLVKVECGYGRYTGISVYCLHVRIGISLIASS